MSARTVFNGAMILLAYILGSRDGGATWQATVTGIAARLFGLGVGLAVFSPILWWGRRQAREHDELVARYCAPTQK